MKHSFFWAVLWINVIFAPVYAGFVIWSIVRWLRETRPREANLRARMGSLGLLCGVVSALLLLIFYCFLRSTGRLIAHGSVLFILDWAGECLAAAGLLTALAARRWLRPTAALINVVTLIKWYGLLIPGLGPATMLSIATYICVALIALFWLIGSAHSSAA